MIENAIASEVVDASYRAHCALGPGLLETVYETVLADDLRRRGLTVMRQMEIPLLYNGIRLDAAFRADLVVENKLIVEVKSTTDVAPLHKKQLLTYLRLANMRLGLLINFNVYLIKDGITRVVNGLEE